MCMCARKADIRIGPIHELYAWPTADNFMDIGVTLGLIPN